MFSSCLEAFPWIVSPLFWLPCVGGMCAALFLVPLGGFLVWRRLSFMGDTLAHTSLLCFVASSLVQQESWIVQTFFLFFASALLVWALEQKRFPQDSILGFFSQSMLALGLFILSLKKVSSIQFVEYLMGDVLLLELNDLFVLGGTLGMTVVFLGAFWRPLLAMSAHHELAQVEGVPTRALLYSLFVLILFSLITAFKILGVLLVGVLLLFPIMTASVFRGSPLVVCLRGAGVGSLCLFSGTVLSFVFDLPVSPLVGLLCLIFFLCAQSLVRHS